MIKKSETDIMNDIKKMEESLKPNTITHLEETDEFEFSKIIQGHSNLTKYAMTIGAINYAKLLID